MVWQDLFCDQGSEGWQKASRYSAVHSSSMAEHCTGALQEHARRLVEECIVAFDKGRDGAQHTSPAF